MITNSNMTICNTKVAFAIICCSILPTDAARLALHFSLVSLFSTYVAMACHNKIIKVADKLKTSRDCQNERVKELQLRLASSLQEIIVLKEEKEKLSATLIAFEESSADAIETAKEEGGIQ
ncbi:hypothetical protein CsSME_00011145 [Camellia sinensis var. sinensis]